MKGDDMKRKRTVIEELTEKATHRGPHTDENISDLFLEDYGQEKFPNLKNDIQFWKRVDYDEDYEKIGYCLLGIGGGDFDEHRYDGKKGRGGCCASLVAKSLGISKRPELVEALQFVTDNDTKGKTSSFDVADMLRTIHGMHPLNSLVGMDWGKIGFRGHINRKKLGSPKNIITNDKIEAISSPKLLVARWMDRKFGRQLTAQEDPALKFILLYSQRKINPENPLSFGASLLARDLYYQYPDNPEIAENWIDLGFNGKYEEQKRFITTTREEFKTKTTIENIPTARERINIATIISDDDLVARFARSKESENESGKRIGLVIQIKPGDKAIGDGFIQIHPNHKFGLSLDGITLAIRKAEQIAQGTENPITDEELLMAEGTLRKAPHWFRHTNNLGLYNGAKSLTGPFSYLTRAQVEECVREGLQIGYEEYQADCEQMRSELEELIEC